MTDADADLRRRAEQWLQAEKASSFPKPDTAALIRDLLAEVVALQQEKARAWGNPEKWMRWCDIRVLERAEAAEAQLQAQATRTAELEQELASPCYCCRADKHHARGGHPAFCQAGCRCWGRCDDPTCCEPVATLIQPGAAQHYVDFAAVREANARAEAAERRLQTLQQALAANTERACKFNCDAESACTCPAHAEYRKAVRQ